MNLAKLAVATLLLSGAALSSAQAFDPVYEAQRAQRQLAQEQEKVNQAIQHYQQQRLQQQVDRLEFQQRIQQTNQQRTCCR